MKLIELNTSHARPDVILCHGSKATGLRRTGRGRTAEYRSALPGPAGAVWDATTGAWLGPNHGESWRPIDRTVFITRERAALRPLWTVDVEECGALTSYAQGYADGYRDAVDGLDADSELGDVDRAESVRRRIADHEAITARMNARMSTLAAWTEPTT